MIENENQYQVTLEQIKRLEDAREAYINHPSPTKLSPLMQKVMQEAINSLLEELREDVEVYNKSQQVNN